MSSWANRNVTKKIIRHKINETKSIQNPVNNIFDINFFNKMFFDFDCNFYKLTNDLEKLNFTDEQLKYHYYTVGRFENRKYNNKIKVIIVCDPFTEGNTQFATGGNIALFNLAYLINNHISFKDKIYCKVYNFDKVFTPNMFCNNYAIDNEVNDNTIVVYPDGNEYNPLGCKNIIRWILLEIGTTYRDKNFYKKWSPTDFVYHWQHSKPNVKILNNTYINPIFINHNNNVRNSTCYLIKKRKFINNIQYVHPYNSICIDNLPLINVVDIFNKCDYFYCYDIKTFLFIGSILCNCKPILIPYDNITKEEFIKESIFNDYKNINKFFAWGLNDIKSINYDSNDINEMISYIKGLSASVDIFLNDIYKYFNNQKYDIPTVKDIYY
jgi:hypothetical protein